MQVSPCRKIMENRKVNGDGDGYGYGYKPLLIGDIVISKIILDLCGGTGTWSKPYLEAGYDVRNITLPMYDVTTYIPPKGVYGILSAPPCQMFSQARNAHNNNPKVKPRNFIEGMNPVNACIRIIFQCQETLVFWALENPVGLLSKFLGKPVYTFEPWWFDGDENWSKRTALWGKFNVPQRVYLNYEDRPDAYNVYIRAKKRYSLRKSKIPSIQDITCGGHKVQNEIRSITPSGFARAFYESNR